MKNDQVNLFQEGPLNELQNATLPKSSKIIESVTFSKDSIPNTDSSKLKNIGLCENEIEEAPVSLKNEICNQNLKSTESQCQYGAGSVKIVETATSSLYNHSYNLRQKRKSKLPIKEYTSSSSETTSDSEDDDGMMQNELAL